MDKKPLLYSEVLIGTKVIDESGDRGTICDIDDAHNVYVDYGNGCGGWYCLDKSCKEYEPIFLDL